MSFTHIISDGPHGFDCGYSHRTTEAARECEANYFEYGTFSDEQLARAEAEAEARYEMWLESGGSSSDRISAEHLEDLAREIQ